MRQLAETVLALTGSKPLPTDDPKQRKPDIKAAQQQLGWMPRVELTEGLIHTIAYFEQLLGVKKRNIKPTPLLGKPGQPLVAGRSYAGGS
jgi:UDP-glucuronate decarboxylase